MNGTWIDAPAKTRAATVQFGDTVMTNAIDKSGHMRHDFTATVRNEHVIDTGVAGHKHYGRVCEIPSEHLGYWGTIAHFTVIERADGTMTAKGWIQGGQAGGRRYVTHHGTDALYEAKQHVTKWATRRFRVAA